MKNFTGWQWLLIDAANQYGHDKKLFEERIEWTESMIAQGPGYLEAKAPMAETKPLYLKAVMAIRKAQQGIPTGHMVGVDACCSGIQVMSALTGCTAGATATGLVDPNVRADAYTSVTNEMSTILGSAVAVSRKDAKDATMTAFYGSKLVPKALFGEDTPELDAFYRAASTVAPGAWELLQDLLASWQPYALSHGWKLPDGFDARVKVMAKREVRIEVDELDHATFTYEFFENQGSRTGLSNVANLTHSMDAYVLREMHRRCNYDREVMEHVAVLIEMEQINRNLGNDTQGFDAGDRVVYYIDQCRRSTLVSAVILPHLTEGDMSSLDGAHLEALASLVNGMLAYQPFPLVTVHDEFKAHANNINHVRYQYKEILAEIADSEVLSDLMSQIHGTPGMSTKINLQLGDLIRGSNYGLC
jgi:hypothetical protein